MWIKYVIYVVWISINLYKFNEEYSIVWKLTYA